MTPTRTPSRRPVGSPGPRRLPALVPLALLFVLGACDEATDAPVRYSVIPAPRVLEPAEGVFELGPDTRIRIEAGGAVEGADALLRAAEWLAEPIRMASGLPLRVEAVGAAVGAGSEAASGVEASGVPDAIVLRVVDTTAPVAFPAPASAERYTLEITPSGAILEADRMPGLFRGLQTLRQLLPTHVEGAFRAVAPWGRGGGAFDAGGRLDQRVALGLEPTTDATDDRATEARDARRFRGVRYVLPAVRIEDEPRFGYRGMHLDVGRHLFPVEFILEYIDLLAMYKMSAFHWHLTEDQGWRVAIDGYPRLTEVGAWRDETMVGRNFDPRIGDGRRYGGWYTKDEVRRVVAYAAERYITVIPEIELPGHSSAAVAAYPELGCSDEADGVATSWGVFEDIYCPSEATFTFLENVLTEVLELFPSPYIHIGGDEAPKTAWEESPVAQDLMEREGLADEQELQSWFIQRIERFLLERDRRLIGWDEILEGGLAPEATVMSWRGTDGGIEAARQGHDVIMTPTSHAYFDFYQSEQTDEAAADWEPGVPREPLAIGGFLPLERVYGFEPVPDELTPEQARFILGAQGNVWTEYIPTPSHVEYMILPRMPAMAEVGWSSRDVRDFSDFERRLGAHMSRWRALGVNYRDPAGR